MTSKALKIGDKVRFLNDVGEASCHANSRKWTSHGGG